MPIRVKVEGHGIVEFPDGTTEDVMRKALSSLKAPEKAEAPTPRGGLTHPLTSVLAPELKGLRSTMDAATTTPKGQPFMARSRTGALYPSETGTGAMNAMKNLAGGAADEAIGQVEGATSPVGLAALGTGAAVSKLASSPPAQGMLGRGLRSISEFDIRKPFKSTLGRIADWLERPPAATPNPSDVPLWKQMEQLPSSGPAPEGRTSGPPISNLGRETAVKPPPPRLAGKAPVVQDEIQKALEEAMGGEAPSLTTAGPEQGITPGGPIRQSGKFGKSQSLGQPGGYSSGNPATTQGESALKSATSQQAIEEAAARREAAQLGSQESAVPLSAPEGSAPSMVPAETPTLTADSPPTTLEEQLIQDAGNVPRTHHPQFERPFNEDIVDRSEIPMFNGADPMEGGIRWTPETWKEFVEQDLGPNQDAMELLAEEAAQQARGRSPNSLLPSELEVIRGGKSDNPFDVVPPDPPSAGPRILRTKELGDWHSGATPGSPEAKRMRGLHMDDADVRGGLQRMMEEELFREEQRRRTALGLP